ncbi:MAG: hypothetical protein MZU97_20765 [Bacillus subtilis]|nr:hypothetical protein [Bacillus subtilis]
MRELLKKYIGYLESKYPEGTIDFSLEKKLLDSIITDDIKTNEEDNFSPGGNYEEFLSFVEKGAQRIIDQKLYTCFTSV